MPAHWWRSWKKAHISALTMRQHSLCSQRNLDVSFPQLSCIFPNLFFVTVPQPFPYLRPAVLGRDVPANVPSATAVDAEGTWSCWRAPPEHHSLKMLDFFSCIFHVIYWFKWKKAATNELITHIYSLPWLVLNLSQLANILPTAPLAHASSPMPLSGTACSDPAQQFLSFLVQPD